MESSRARWILGACIGVVGCAVPNPLFIQTADPTLDTGDAVATSSDTSGANETGTSSPGSSTTDPMTTVGASTASDPLCGDGNVDPGEDCDDGNAIPGDGCESNCRPLFPKDPALIPGAAGALGVAIGDADNDGDNDVFLVFNDCPGACVRRYLNSGNAIFAQDQQFNAPTEIDRLVVAELGGDPGVDVAYASGGWTYIHTESGVQLPAVQLPGEARSLVAAEIEGGGPADLLIVDDLNGHINYAIAGNGGFLNYVTISEVSAPRRAAVADVNKDGVTDFLFTAEGGNGIGLFLDLGHDGGPEGPFATEATTAAALVLGNFANVPGFGPNAAFYGQVQTGGSLQVYVNQGMGAFDKFKNNVAAKDDVMELFAPRLNSATDDNIIALSPLSLQIFTLVDGDFKAGPSLSLNDELRDMAAGDLNGDGRVDLAVVGKNNLYVMINQAP